MAETNEAAIEKYTLELLQEQGYAYLSGKDLENEREDASVVILQKRLEKAVTSLNPNIPEPVIQQALRQVASLQSENLIEGNKDFYKMLIEGVAEEYQKKGAPVGAKVKLIDFDNPKNNDLVVCNQFNVRQDNKSKRPDVVVFINGLPMVVIELKNPTDEKADTEEAFNQLQTYKEIISNLFCYNGCLVISDGSNYAKMGSLTSDFNRFMEWKTKDDENDSPSSRSKLQLLIEEMLNPTVLLDLIRNFTVFEETITKNLLAKQTRLQTHKKIAAYHQYYAVKKTVESTIEASSEKGNRKIGVIWHTQGSGKSLSMVFYAGLLAVNKEMRNPTILVITDRNDLDNQLFNAFSTAEMLLRQQPKQAGSRNEMREFLKTEGGGVIFSTIQKFSPENDAKSIELLSDRKNIVVIADEAHRSQYGFSAKNTIDEKKNEVKTKYGFAKYLRDALPNASFVGFTGTPIEKTDASTPEVFGDYIDKYDIKRAVDDGATVPIYYEQRLVKVHLESDELEELDESFELMEESQDSDIVEKFKKKLARRESIIGDKDRIKEVATDIVSHFTKREAENCGKAMIVTSSRRIAVAMYDQIKELSPDWFIDVKDQSVVKVIMTSSSSDPPEWQPHSTTKKDRREAGEHFKDPDNSLKIVIVCDMWLTGFDAPCLDTLYIDKILSGHNLMQAIARVNRVFRDKTGGLIVDYIGIASNLREAVAQYIDSGEKGKPAFDKKEAINQMLEKYDILEDMFANFDYKRFFTANTGEKLLILQEAQEYILNEVKDGKKRFMQQVSELSKAHRLSVPSEEAEKIEEGVSFFKSIKSCLMKFDSQEGGENNVKNELHMKQLVDEAIVVEGIVDVYDAAGIKKPDVSVLSDEFLKEIEEMPHPNLRLELLLTIIKNEIKARESRNLVQSRKFSEMLMDALSKYNNNILTSAKVLEILFEIAREMRASDEAAQELGLSEDEIAFYDALVKNESAKDMGDDTLKKLAQLLVEDVKKNATIDWTIRESAKASMRLAVKKLLKKYDYPPDQQESATTLIIEQAEQKAEQWTLGL